MAMHDDEIQVSEPVVRSLLKNQFPELGGEPILKVESSGTVNAIFRIGEDLAARFPLRRRNPGVEWEALEVEASASAEFSRCSPFPGPQPVAIGEPGESYPLPWVIQTWLPGTVAEDGSGAASTRLALDIVELITALRSVDTIGRSFGRSGRGGDLRDHDAWVQECLKKSRSLLDVPRLSARWDQFVGLPRSAQDVMSHGDLTLSNVLVADGRLVGVLDCGGFGPADPALDLIAAWHLLDDERREVFREALAPGALEWERGKAWAFEQSMGAVWYYEHSNPSMSAMGRRTLERILADSAS